MLVAVETPQILLPLVAMAVYMEQVAVAVVGFLTVPTMLVVLARKA